MLLCCSHREKVPVPACHATYRIENGQGVTVSVRLFAGRAVVYFAAVLGSSVPAGWISLRESDCTCVSATGPVGP